MANLQKMREETINTIYYVSTRKAVHELAVVQVLKLNKSTGIYREIYYKKVKRDNADIAFEEQKALILNGHYNNE